MSIKPLPGDVVAQIKSSVAITSLNNVICGLVKNALDAEASKINLTVDYSRGNCSIEDNGFGIPPSEFKDTGGLGQLHYTSKHPPRPDVHGKYGVFLASVASLSLLTITSHHRDYHSHNSMSVHNSKVLMRHTPCLPEQRILTFSHGTRVTVRDLFGSMPVRVKHRALQAEKSFFSRDWDQLLLDLVALLIAWPGAISVSIREPSNRQNLVLRTASVSWLSDSCRLLHQASLCDSPSASDWVSIGASAPALSISGYVCREPVATKRVQFISLGIEPLSNESRSNILYEEVNKVFADSSFGAIDDDGDPDGETKEIKTDGFVQRELKIRKGVDRWPMFFLKISPASSATERSLEVDDILDDRQPNLGLVTDLLKAVFYEFLKKNFCRPRKVALSAKSRSRPQQENDHFSNNGGAILANPVKTRPKSGQSPNPTQAEEPARKTPRVETMDNRLESPVAASSRIKTGHTLPTFKESAQPPSRTQSASLTAVGTGKMTPWIGDLINKWKNPVFELTERPIPKLPDVSDMLGIDPRPAGYNCDHGLPAFSVGSQHDTSAMGLQSRLSKDALENAELIAQVDRKFILAKVPFDLIVGNGGDPSSSFLVLIDQHAADERCRVEALMKDYFVSTVDDNGTGIWKAVTELLPKPVQFEIPSQDKSVLYRSQEYFAYWGILYDVVTGASDEGGVGTSKKKVAKIKAKVVVRSLPPAIIERCRTEPRLLAELIRKEAWKRNDEAGLAQQPTPRPVIVGGDSQDGPAWVSLFHGCPHEIVELINSRSCRSAIMFNDPLSLDQCGELLERLVKCAFPFQCAHGRPSMVPLVNLGDGLVEIGTVLDGIERKEREDTFGYSFGRWKQSRCV
ncbi:DNA mismatch repair protein MLH3 [Cytospora mali]|uniref:DNA mismatch repair protein MLH3 n=1 Tax=Cytospora mali TaxID=578113 RepID=A0A194V393_CYTMA|nr:DNA mismatch repair protein MLH3 [Valsa mali var. pyri (nom. inval.)]